MSAITAILPAFNKEVSIGSVVLRTKQYVDLMDDGSSDRTADVAAMAGAKGHPAPAEQGQGRGAGNCEFFNREFMETLCGII
ncbi:MAG: hypothetical protein A4E46_00012 [Methanosaeta sp. PtaU1.Bin016]|jgi:glycosyltransferase involved in cell wall biosynthesis|nr:MAG: hypothetical protein A4E46_00012 [Methanosaeta sp. PtaU1.Bin016]